MKAHEPRAGGPGRIAGRWSAPVVHMFLLAALTVLALYVCFLIVRPFFSALAWALALAIAGYPLHRGISRRVRQPTLAAGASLAAMVILLFAPAGLLLPQMIDQAVVGVNAVRSHVESGDWQRTIEQHRWIRPAWDWLEARVDLKDILQNAAGWITGMASGFLRGSLAGMLQLLIVFFLLFYFFRDARPMLVSVASLLPLSAGETTRIFEVVRDTIYATLFGKLLIAVLQGLLGGLMMWWLGLTAPWFWALVMGVLSIVPAVGTALVWLPASLFLVLGGNWGKGIIMFGWGLLVVGLVDNFLYPVLVRHRIRLHTVPIFLAMLGGVFVLGPAGFFLGPVILAVTITLLEIWRKRLGTLDEGTPPEPS